MWNILLIEFMSTMKMSILLQYGSKLHLRPCHASLSKEFFKKMGTEMDFWLALRSIEAHVYLVRGVCSAISSCVPFVKRAKHLVNR